MIEGNVRGAHEIDDEFADLFEATATTTESATSSITGDADPTVNLICNDREATDGYGLLHNKAMADKVFQHRLMICWSLMNGTGRIVYSTCPCIVRYYCGDQRPCSCRPAQPWISYHG